MKTITRCLALGAAVAALGPAQPTEARGFQAENSIKAAFVFNFAKLTTFPGSGPLTVGIIGASPAAEAVERVLDGKDANGRKIEVKKISAGQASSVQIAFVAGSGGAPSVGSSAVLTVGEADGFAKGGGAIGFVMDGGKVRFEINMGVIKKAGLKLDDKLVALGKTVG